MISRIWQSAFLFALFAAQVSWVSGQELSTEVTAGEYAVVTEESPVVTEELGPPTETFYQLIDVQRNPQFIVQGLKTGQQIHYQISSSFKIYEADDEGYHKAVQTVVATKLLKADALSQAVFAKSLAAMKGQVLTYTVTEDGEILSVAGHQANSETVAVAQPKSKGMLVSTVMDEDGWKELAQLTLFQPPKTKATKPFIRKTTHDWGSLGSWYGETQFKAKTKSKKPKRYEYQHKLEYISPNKKEGGEADGGAGNGLMGLPFAIEDAKFKVHKGAGEIIYDTKKGHVTGVRELFHARGTIATKTLGQSMKIAIDEKQIFQIKISGYQKTKSKKVSDSVPSAECDPAER